jgi:hypothetical protein
MIRVDMGMAVSVLYFGFYIFKGQIIQ